MTTQYPLQASFAKGELTPKLRSRIDTDFYRTGLEVCENFLVMRQGGVRKRSGTRFIAEVHDHNVKSRLAPFVFKTEQAYIIELGHQVARFFRDQGIIVDGGLNPVELTMPYTSVPGGETEEVLALDHAQSQDTLYVTHKNHFPRKIVRTSHTNWTLNPLATTDGPWLPLNIEANDADMTDGQRIIVGTTYTIAFDNTLGINEDTGFTGGDVGRQIRLQVNDANPPYEDPIEYWGELASVINATSGTVTVRGFAGQANKNGLEITEDYTAAGDIENTNTFWRLGAWHGTGNYPAYCTFWNGKLAFSRSDQWPQTTWASKSGSFENFAPTEQDGTITAANGMTLTINASQSNEVLWSAEFRKTLYLGTSSAVRALEPENPNAVLTGANVTQNAKSEYGCAPVFPIQIGNVLLYAGLLGEELREVSYSLSEDSEAAPDISVISDHLYSSGLVNMAYAQRPNSIGWCTRGDGQMVAVTHEREQQMLAQSRHKIAGDFQGSGHGVVEWVTTIPGADFTEVWMIVKRTINGATRRYIEMFEEDFDTTRGHSITDGRFLDSCITYTGAPVNAITGVDHLEGETVGIVADGVYLETAVVTGGGVTLPRNIEASVICVGLLYEARLRTMPYAGSGPRGTSFGQNQIVHAALVGIRDTVNLEVGTETEGRETLYPLLKERVSGELFDQPVLHDGVHTVDVSDAWQNAGQINVVSRTPYPASVLSIGPGIDAGGS